MAGRSKITEMASLRVPRDVMQAMRETAFGQGRSWASWAVEAFREKLERSAGVGQPPTAGAPKKRLEAKQVTPQRSVAPACPKCGFGFVAGKCGNRGCK